MSNSIQNLASQMQGLIENGNGSMSGGFMSITNGQVNNVAGLDIVNDDYCQNEENCSGSTNNRGCANRKVCFTSDAMINSANIALNNRTVS